MTIRYRAGAASIEIGGEWARAIREAVDRLAPELGATLEREANEIRQAAQARWPIGKDQYRKGRILPHSIDLFWSGLRINPPYVEGFIMNRAPWFFYIKSMKNGLNGKSASVELVRKPMRRRATPLARELADQIRGLLK